MGIFSSGSGLLAQSQAGSREELSQESLLLGGKFLGEKMVRRDSKEGRGSCQASWVHVASRGCQGRLHPSYVDFSPGVGVAMSLWNPNVCMYGGKKLVSGAC